MSLKTVIAPTAHKLAWATGFSTARAKLLRTGRIIAFHGVGDESYPTVVFERQLAWLAENFSIVSLATFLERMATGLSDEVVLTFDDGLRNNFNQAWPLLKRYNAPATFFVVAGLVDSGRWLWTHEARSRLAMIPPAQRKHLSVTGALETDHQVLERMKRLDLPGRISCEETIRRLTPDFQPTLEQRDSYDLMSWREIAQLDPALITIGSHSLMHPILSTLSGAELESELVASRRLLESKLGRPVDFFCYPNGAYSSEVVRLVAANYRAAVSSVGAFVGGGENPHLLPRIGITPDMALFAWRMHRPTA